jgi:hypothetical protein
LSRLMSNVCRPYLTATIATIVSRMAYLKPKTSWTDAPWVRGGCVGHLNEIPVEHPQHEQ